MLWSLFKILLFVAIVAALTFAAGYVIENGPPVVISVAGYKEVALGPLQAVLLAGLAVVALWVVFKVLSFGLAFLRFLLGDETAISRYFDRRSERRGYRAMTDALMALSSGEPRQAIAKAAQAEKYLGSPEVSNMITAEAASMMGETSKAQEAYKALLGDQRTRFAGIRGIMKQKLAEGDTDTALALAQKAYVLKPKNEEMQDTLLQLQAEKHDWKGARKTLESKRRTGSIPRDLHRRRDAVLAVSEAKDILDDGKSMEARDAAIEANKLSPDLIPAACMAARAHIEKGKPRQAVRVLKKTWEVSPHPDLAVAFAEIVPDEDPKARIKRFEDLTKINPDHPETRMLLAELAISAEDFPAARRAIGDLATTTPNARSLSIMAAIERGEGADEALVRGWLAKAVTAARGPQWTCDKCQHVEPVWGPVCSNCGGFDTLSWRDQTVELTMPTGTDMLPLVVGKSPDPAEVESPTPESEGVGDDSSDAAAGSDPASEATSKVEILDPEPKK